MPLHLLFEKRFLTIIVIYIKQNVLDKGADDTWLKCVNQGFHLKPNYDAKYMIDIASCWNPCDDHKKKDLFVSIYIYLT